MSERPNPRIRVLVADDEAGVVDAYRSILDTPEPRASAAASDLRAKLFGGGDASTTPATPAEAAPEFVLTCVRGAEAAVEAVRESVARDECFALVFLDMRMPPGEDGARAAERIRALDARIDIVTATAYSDTDPTALSTRILPAAKMFYVQKPFHPHEIRQLALAIGGKRAIEDVIYRLAYFDSLTGLPNRQCFLDKLEAAIATAGAAATELAVFFLDLDHFKRINDTLGHTTGDHVLRVTAERIRQALRAGDVVSLPSGLTGEEPEDSSVARLGGDEFTVLVSGLKGADDVFAVAQRVHAALSEPIVLEQHEIAAVPSMGIARYPADASDAQALIKCADMAMYQAKKESGTRQPRFYETSMNEIAMLRMSLEHELRHAIERDELSLHFQPQLSLDSGNISGMEALLRWSSPVLGDMPPLQFIPVAEESGLIVPIGEWVLRKACLQAASWQREGTHFGRVAVNVSTVQFAQHDFPELVAGVLEGVGLDAGLLELEITESVLMHDAEQAVAQLRALKALGVQIAIDDFGTGYSSLSYLKRFPVDRLKIDRSFIQTILSDLNDQAIASAVIAMAERMQLFVTAEGVENDEQLQFLQNGHCNEAQGFEIGRPMSATEAETFLRTRPTSTRRVA